MIISHVCQNGHQRREAASMTPRSIRGSVRFCATLDLLHFLPLPRDYARRGVRRNGSVSVMPPVPPPGQAASGVRCGAWTGRLLN